MVTKIHTEQDILLLLSNVAITLWHFCADIYGYTYWLFYIHVA